ncbi:zinc transporter ZIP1-like isoform X2 [Belonocnema kinseyi]|uniref:zinc transporter ZIP1-like isoform X2 n=1 Tax=Belonocnema kinseyi TaxID=2817044 RepID=UPI00143D4435|nr:zinc transporter ZIP1-like isoform X2 [Belonocnema kinseyi]XP_033231462.1 zinc transporter ZIP1-like isoform X2 [Belonocnema kinseyi]XP_033231463.1 zinc transporter ZIP1-like isoform X2 [Belonocnema kinseyi]
MAHEHHHDGSIMQLIPLNTSDRLSNLEHDATDKQTAVQIAKGVTMIVLCSVSICMGLLPIQMAKWLKWTSSKSGNTARSSKLVSLLLGFGGGVLFCTTFLHLLPEVSHGVAHLVEDGQIPELIFSIPETLTCLGFFIMYLVEELIHSRLRKKESHAAAKFNMDVNHSTNELVENGKGHSSLPSGRSNACNGHSHLPIADDGESFEINSLRGLLIVMGLSVHELFEGLAIGLESSSAYVWYMFAAVAAHKFVIAFCIGVELIAAKTKIYLSIIYICMFAVVSPVGIGIGMLLVGGGSAAASGPLAVVLQGIASGTLLYVVFFEVLHEHRTGLGQYFSILTGFILMFGLQMLTAHSHSHGHSHGQENHEEHPGDVGHSHDHEHEGEEQHYAIGGAIDRVTDSLVDVVSQALSSTTTPSSTSISSMKRILESSTKAGSTT